MVRRIRPTAMPHMFGGARGLVTAAVTTVLLGGQIAAPAYASADASPGAPVISVTTKPPAGTHACPPPTGGLPPKLAMGTLCSFTLSPNPADTSVPTEYEVSYPFDQGSPEHITAADPGNGNSFDATTGVATITIVVNDEIGTLTVNTVDAGNQVGPATQQYVDGQDPVSLGTSQVFGDYDGDGTPDLVAAPLKAGDALANGLWFARGGAGGTVSRNAENLSVNALGAGLSPFGFTGAELVLGNWCGTGNTAMLAYFPPTAPTGDAGGGYVFCGSGDSDVVRNAISRSGVNSLASGSLSDANGGNPTELVDAGGLTRTNTGFPDVIAVIDNQLLLAPTAMTAGYSSDGGFGSGLCAFGDCTLLSSTPSPDGAFDWDAWNLVGYPLANGDIDMYLWNPATGELVLWSDITANDAANDGVWSNYTTLHYTQHVIASGTGISAWNRGAALELQAADFNGDGIPDLWAVDPATATAVPYTAKIKASGAKLTKGARQPLVTPGHEWELNDLASGSASQAFDSGSDTAYTLRNASAGAAWVADSRFGAVVRFDGASGYLRTNPQDSSSGAAVAAGSSFTLGAWVRPSGSGTVFSQEGTDDSSFFLSAVADGTWQFGINTAGTTAPSYAQDTAASWTVGTWTHVVLTYDASIGSLVLYVDGVRAASVHVSGAATVNGPFVLGANQAGGALGSYFNGEIARAVTFGTALTSQEVKKLP